MTPINAKKGSNATPPPPPRYHSLGPPAKPDVSWPKHATRVDVRIVLVKIAGFFTDQITEPSHAIIGVQQIPRIFWGLLTREGAQHLHPNPNITPESIRSSNPAKRLRPVVRKNKLCARHIVRETGNSSLEELDRKRKKRLFQKLQPLPWDDSTFQWVG